MSFSETLDMNVSPDEAFARAVRTAEFLGWGLKEANPQARRFCAVTSAGVRSFGELVTAEIVSVGNGSQIRVRSKCRAQLVSWGKNSENVIRFFQAIQQHQASSGGTETHSMSTTNTTTVAANGFCTSCGSALQIGTRFCGKCGTSTNDDIPNRAPMLRSQPAVAATNYLDLSDHHQKAGRVKPHPLRSVFVGFACLVISFVIADIWFTGIATNVTPDNAWQIHYFAAIASLVLTAFIMGIWWGYRELPKRKP